LSTFKINDETNINHRVPCYAMPVSPPLTILFHISSAMGHLTVVAAFIITSPHIRQSQLQATATSNLLNV